MLTRQGSRERTTFRLQVAVQQLEATLNYEASKEPALAQVSVQDLGFSLALHPASMALWATLGNVRAQDCSLPQVRLAVPGPASAAAGMAARYVYLLL